MATPLLTGPSGGFLGNGVEGLALVWWNHVKVTWVELVLLRVEQHICLHTQVII